MIWKQIPVERRMIWLQPIVNANYCKAKKSGTGFNLTAPQIRRIKERVHGLRKYTKKRSGTIKDLAIELGVNESTVRRAATR